MSEMSTDVSQWVDKENTDVSKWVDTDVSNWVDTENTGVSNWVDTEKTNVSNWVDTELDTCRWSDERDVATSVSHFVRCVGLSHHIEWDTTESSQWVRHDSSDETSDEVS